MCGVTFSQIGFRDSFRERHLQSRAFTYYTGQGTASRIDQWWARAPVGSSLDILNATVVWAWPLRADHAPVLADFLCTLPSIQGIRSSTSSRPWRRLITQMDKPNKISRLRETVRESCAAHQDSFGHASEALRTVARAINASPHPTHQAIGPWEPFVDPRSPLHRQAIEDAAATIEGTLVACIPWPRLTTSSRPARQAASAWQLCIFKLRAVRTALRSRGPESPTAQGRLLIEADVAWKKARRLSEMNRSQEALSRQQGPSQWDVPGSDLFWQEPVRWAASLGFTAQLVEPWAAEFEGQAQRGRNISQTREVVPVSLTWPSSGVEACALLVQSWIDIATRMRSSSLRTAARSFCELRRVALRQGDVGRWSRMSKRLVAGPSYSPLWFRAPSGQKIRPTDAIQVREAASQEWSVLCQEPAQAWDSTRLLPWHDAAGHRRASVDIRELGDNDMRTPSGLTFLGYLGPSSWIHLVRWSSQQGPMSVSPRMGPDQGYQPLLVGSSACPMLRSSPACVVHKRS